MSLAEITSYRRWPLRRRAAWLVLFLALVGWSAMLQPPSWEEPAPRVGYFTT